MSEDSTDRLKRKIEVRRLAARTDLWVLNQATVLGDPARAARVLGLRAATIARILIEQRKVRASARSV